MPNQPQTSTYSVPFPAAAAPEFFEVVFTVNAQDGDDLLVGTMKLPQAASSDPVVSVTPCPGWRHCPRRFAILS